MTGGEALVKMFQAHQIEIAFGMGGFQVLPYYNALAGQNQIRHVLIRDEKHGAFAADGYARVQNKPAIADATLGPGATNLVSGAAESFGASIPMILLTGEVSSMIAGRGATQESDQVGMLKPTCKASITVSKLERVRTHDRLVLSAVTKARRGAGRPRPILPLRKNYRSAKVLSRKCRVFSIAGEDVQRMWVATRRRQRQTKQPLIQDVQSPIGKYYCRCGCHSTSPYVGWLQLLPLSPLRRFPPSGLVQTLARAVQSCASLLPPSHLTLADRKRLVTADRRVMGGHRWATAVCGLAAA
jgi:hypothetical protein